jgi:hypothetical protein
LRAIGGEVCDQQAALPAGKARLGRLPVDMATPETIRTWIEITP